MSYYNELLADVRREIRRIRREEKLLDKTSHGYYKKTKEQYELEKAKLKKITGSKYKWSLGSMRKTTENLEKVLEELKTFTSQPTILKSDRENRYEKRVNEFMHNWDLSRTETDKFFDIINSSEIQSLVEGRYLDSDDIIDLATNKESARRTISNLTNMSDNDRKTLSSLPKSERAEFLRDVIKRR